MAKFAAKIVTAPRIEVALVPHGDASIGPYSLWLILHTPGEDPHTVPLGMERLSKEQAVQAMLAIYTSIGSEFGFPAGAPPGRA